MKECERAQKCCALTMNLLYNKCMGYAPDVKNDEPEHSRLKCKNEYGEPISPVPTGPYDEQLF